MKLCLLDGTSGERLCLQRALTPAHVELLSDQLGRAAVAAACSKTHNSAFYLPLAELGPTTSPPPMSHRERVHQKSSCNNGASLFAFLNSIPNSQHAQKQTAVSEQRGASHNKASTAPGPKITHIDSPSHTQCRAHTLKACAPSQQNTAMGPVKLNKL